MNLAQRLESNSDVGGILLSYETGVHVQDMVDVEPRGAIQMKGICRHVQTYAVKGRRRIGDAPAFALEHPAGIAIDLDPTALDADERSALAERLAALAERLRG